MRQILLRLFTFALVAACFSSPAVVKAQYVTPDSGFYWNPAASGTGFQIEFQDSIMSLTYFAYNRTGQATFFVLSGRFDVVNNRLAGDLIAFSNGQCIGCTFSPPVAVVVGPATIQFRTRSTATVTFPVAGGGFAQIPIQRLAFGYGSNLVQSNVGVWGTTIIFTNDEPIGDLIRIFTTVNTATGAVSAGNLYPFRQPVAGGLAGLPGTNYNFLWLIQLNATQNVGYLGEFTLGGFLGVSFVYPRGGQVPTTGATAVATRIAGPDTANQLLGAFAPSQAPWVDSAKARAKAQQNATKKLVESDEAHAALTGAVRRLESAMADPSFKAQLNAASE